MTHLADAPLSPSPPEKGSKQAFSLRAVTAVTLRRELHFMSLSLRYNYSDGLVNRYSDRNLPWRNYQPEKCTHASLLKLYNSQYRSKKKKREMQINGWNILTLFLKELSVLPELDLLHVCWRGKGHGYCGSNRSLLPLEVFWSSESLKAFLKHIITTVFWVLFFKNVSHIQKTCKSLTKIYKSWSACGLVK